MADLADVLQTILDADQQTLDLVFKAAQSRSKTLRDAQSIENLTKFYVGDRVRLINISPKKLDGAYGRITAIKPGEKHPFSVMLDTPVDNWRHPNVFGHQIEKVD